MIKKFMFFAVCGILGLTQSIYAQQQDVLTVGAEGLAAEENGVITLGIESNTNIVYTACQMDIVVPEELNMGNISLVSDGIATESHLMEYVTLSDGKTLRVMVYSSQNAKFTSKNGNLLQIAVAPQTEGNYTLSVKDIHFSWSDKKTSQDYALTDVSQEISVSAPLDIASLTQTLPERKGLYNLAGQKVSRDYKGIVIVNGRKEVRR